MNYLALFAFIFFINSLCANGSKLEELLEGNRRYRDNQLEHPNRSLERRQETTLLQEPFAVIVGCSDSRVAPEIIFDQGIGDLFVVRIAGNVVGTLAKESIEYAVFHLNASTILVLGHENCGAVNAVVKKMANDIPEIASIIEPAVNLVRTKNPPNLLEAAIKENAIRMRDDIAQDPTFKKRIDEKKLEVYAGYFRLESGMVEVLNH